MNTLKTICLLIAVLCAWGCVPQPGAEQVEATRRQGLERLKDAETEARAIDDVRQRARYWQTLLGEQPFSADSVLKAKIHYQLAGVYYAKNDMDSIKWHMRRAWSLIDGQSGVEDMLVLFNVGEGNIATHEQYVHQANYYYNLALTIIQHMGDNPTDISAVQQAMIYLAAAQSDAGLHQYERAIVRNHRAIALLAQDTVAQPRLLHRAYDQLASDFLSASEKQADSALTYIRKMEALAETHPGAGDVRFLYDRKAMYFSEVGDVDSAVHYHRLIRQIDGYKVEAGAGSPVDHANLFKDYINLSGGFIQLGRLDSAAFYLEKSSRFLDEQGQYLTAREHILYRENLVNYLFATHQYNKAYEEHLNVLEATRALSENKYAQAVAEMSAIYELQAKEKSISELNQQVIRTEGKLAENRLLLIITTLSALLAVAIVILLYVGRKQRELREKAKHIQLQKSAIELEQRLLRTQMEPHFVFNTLGALQSFIRLDEKQQALKYLGQFSRLLRNSLELSRESLVPLADELETLSYYLELQRMRFDNRFDFHIDRGTIDDDELQEWLIPPMLIQPFVENAIVHGVDNLDGKGEVIVVVAKDGDAERLKVTISDNGPGIDATQLRPKGKKKSLSTTISRERLQILQQERGMVFGVTVTDRSKLPGGRQGTLVELLMPVSVSF